MRFAIYIPGDSVANEQKLTSVGLGHLARGCSCTPAPVGPDGKGGVVFSWPTNDPRSVLSYLPGQQEWIPAVAHGDQLAARYWVGFINGARPTPKDLQYATQFDGGYVVMGDGRQWNIPAAGMLPKDVVLEADGRPVEQVQAAFVEFWEQSQHWFDWLMECDFDNPEAEWDVRIWELLERALCMNYMLTREVISHLRLITTLTRATAVLAVMGGLQIRDNLLAQKKTEPEPAAT